MKSISDLVWDCVMEVVLDPKNVAASGYNFDHIREGVNYFTDDQKQGVLKLLKVESSVLDNTLTVTGLFGTRHIPLNYPLN